MIAENPVDPRLSGRPGAERRSLLIPLSIVAGLVVIAALVWFLKPRGPLPPYLAFENREIGAHFEYPSELRAGPNFVRAPSGSILTVERYSLYKAKKDWVAQLPDILFEQVLITIKETYPEATEVSRTPVVVDGRKGVEIVCEGRVRPSAPKTLITTVIFSSEDWVYVLRSYSPEALDAKERPLFRRVRETWKFLPEPGEGPFPAEPPR